ncbi:MAG: molybdate ABC transporter substrate-binding protein [Parvibaculum sp.]
MKIKLAALLLAFFVAAAPARAEDAPSIAAASDLQFALTDVAAAFTAATGKMVRLSFGSSGNFFRQIRQGAPFEMFLSADEAFVQDLAAAGETADEGALYGVGRIVLILPKGSPLAADGSLADLAAALEDGRLKKFAIANPEHAPYGRAAEEALRHAGLWEAIQDRLVHGENVSQAAQFALSGSTQGGIVAWSLALAPEVAARGTYAPIPETAHKPLRQRMVLLKGAGGTARAFHAFMQGEEARAIMRRYGFVLPGETM